MLARQAKKWPAARELGKQLEAKVKGGASVAQAAKALGVPNQTLGPFSRIDAPLGDPVIVGAAFALDSGKVSRLIETKQGLYLLRCLGRTKADSSLFAKQGTEARNQLTRQLRQQRVRNYLVALRESAKVEDRRAEIFKTEAQTESSP